MKLSNKIIIIIIIFALGFNNVLLSQSVLITKIIDKENNENIIGANIVLTLTNDSSYIKGTTSDFDGNAIINAISRGKYKLEVSYIGYITINDTIEIDKDTIHLNNIYIKPNVTLLNEIVIVDKAAQVLIKGDTIEFNTVGLKITENSVVEDLLKKLPGVEVSAEGKITVNGKEVTKIRVDGKKFFDDDPEMATKNIPAEMIEKIQVIEQKSEMAQLTGFEDDDSEQIINLTFKENKKRGVFGNFSAGIGSDLNPDLRYNANGFLNLITNNSQTAFTADANNINKSRSTRGRSGISGNKGITFGQNFGITNSTYINSKINIGGDLIFNHSSNEQKTNTNKETFLESGSNIRNDSTNSNNDLYSVNGRIELSYDIDKYNKLIVQPNVGYTKTLSNSMQKYEILSNEDTLSSGFNSNEAIKKQENGGIKLAYNHKSKQKTGRTFTTQIIGNASISDRNSFNKGENEVINSNIETSLDQKTIQKEENYNTNLRISWVEPLWNNYNLLEISTTFRGNFSNSEKKQWDKDSSEYTIFDQDYSNTINNMFFSEIGELNYRFTQEKYNLTAGFRLEPSQTFNSVVYGNNSTQNFTNSIINYAPTLRFVYNFDKKHNIRLNYRGRTSQPSINQLQPVKDNSNLMNENIGNPELNPAFNHSLSFNYNKYWTDKMSSLNAYLNSSLTQNALISNSIVVLNGKLYTQTVNSKKLPYNVNFGLTYNIPIINKLINFNTNTRISYSKRYGFSANMNIAEIDNILNLPLGNLNNINSASLSEIISLSYNNDYLEISGRGTYRYSNTWNNLKLRHDLTHDLTTTGFLIVKLPLNFNINSDIIYTMRSGYSSFNRNEIIWNAGIEKSFLKNTLILSVQAYDILHQRQNIQQIIGDNYIQYSESNTLQTYIMFSLTYKISKFSGMTSSEIENGSKNNRRGNRSIP